MEVKRWEKKNSDMALYEVNQEFESHRLQLQQANQWDGQARLKERQNKIVWRIGNEE